MELIRSCCTPLRRTVNVHKILRREAQPPTSRSVEDGSVIANRNRVRADPLVNTLHWRIDVSRKLSPRRPLLHELSNSGNSFHSPIG